MATIERKLEIDVPVRTAYDQWTQFEDFPRFMEGVKSVRQLDERRLAWTAEVMGRELSWTAEIVDQVPDRSISWRSTSGPQNQGTVSFRELAPDRTEVSLKLEYEPEGAAETTAAALGLVGVRVSGDLDRFKKFIESRGQPTGAWRGEIHGGQH
jgi:uncharacterized membrane protein